MPTSISVRDAAGTARTVATLDAIAALLGEVAASPTTNTLLDRVKALSTTLSGPNHIGKVGRSTVRASNSFVRPADTNVYAVGDLVANSVTAASVAAIQLTVARVVTGSFAIHRVKVKKSNTTLTNASFRVHLYGVDPALSTGILNGDNGVWSTNDSTSLGYVDVTVDTAMRDSAHGFASLTTPIRHALAAGQIVYALLEARGIYTPASAETFTVELEVVQD